MDFGSFFDGDLTGQERACFESFGRFGHRLTVYSYAPLALPGGVANADAEAILPRDTFYRIGGGPHRGTVAEFSNRFRYAMIRATGLVWVDSDILCLRADWPEPPVLIGRQDDCLVNGAVLGLPRDHPALADAVAVSERLGAIAIWGLTGPHLISALVHQHGLEQQVLPRTTFYPLHYSEVAKLLQPIGADQRIVWPESTCCVHLWNEMLRFRGYDRRAGPPPGSVLERLLQD